MNDKLSHAISAARSDTQNTWNETWSDNRSARVLSSTLALHERRILRTKVMHRSIVVLSVAAVMALVFLRGIASTSASTTNANANTNASTNNTLTAMEPIAMDDAGYGYSRD